MNTQAGGFEAQALHITGNCTHPDDDCVYFTARLDQDDEKQMKLLLAAHNQAIQEAYDMGTNHSTRLGKIAKRLALEKLKSKQLEMSDGRPYVLVEDIDAAIQALTKEEPKE